VKKYLVIAFYDGDKKPLVDTLRQLSQETPSEFHLIVPATAPADKKWAWSEEEAYHAAKERLAGQLAELNASGANLTGEIVNNDDLAAVDEALQKDSYDELIVATPSDSDTRTPFEEFQSHVRRQSNIPIRHVTADQAESVERG
jgi:hypothetical protein